MTISIHHGELDQSDVQALLALHVAAMRGQSPEDACHVLPSAALAHPSITFLTLREHGRLLGIGALKALGGDQGEVKSMRTAPEALGRGIGRAMLAAITAEARTRGYWRLLLETGRSGDFAAANALYEKAGFRDCGAFGDYPPGAFTRFMALDL